MASWSCCQQALLQLVTRYVSQILVNCRNKLYNKSKTNRSSEVRGLSRVHSRRTELNWSARSWPNYIPRYWSRASAARSWLVAWLQLVNCSLVQFVCCEHGFTVDRLVVTSKQPRIFDCRIGVVSKLDRRRLVFTARCYASAVLAMGLCPSVSVSVTSRCSTKTAKRRITQTTPHDTPGSLVFWCQRSPRNSTGVTSYEGAECRCGGQNRRLSTNNRLYLENGKRQTHSFY